MPKTKPYETKIDRDLAIQLLNSSGENSESGLLGDALVRTAAQLADLAEKANKFLKESEFSEIVADHLARKHNKRGHAEINVSRDGHVMLIVTYEEKPKARRKSRTRRAPLLKELRAKAEELGVDITEFGIKRRQIWEHLQRVESGEVVTKKPKKTPSEPKPESEAKKPPPEADNGPMSAGPDETRVSAPPTQKPPRKPVVETVRAVVSPVIVDAGSTPKLSVKKDLRALAEKSKDVDIAALIDSEAK